MSEHTIKIPASVALMAAKHLYWTSKKVADPHKTHMSQLAEEIRIIAVAQCTQEEMIQVIEIANKAFPK